MRILALPAGQEPLRTVIDNAHAGVEAVNDLAQQTREAFVERMGSGQVLHVQGPTHARQRHDV